MSSGYEQFFKKARQATSDESGKEMRKETSRKKNQTHARSFSVKPEYGDLDPRSASRNSSPQQSRRGKFSVGAKEAAQSPEDTLRRALASRMESKKKLIQRKRRGFPFASAAVVAVALAIGGIGFYYPSTVDWIMTHVEVGAFGQAEATTEKVAAPDAAKKEKTAAAASPGTATPAAEVEKKDQGIANIKNWSPEELSFFNKLNDRKKELDLREAELNKLDEELHQQKSVLDQKIEQLEKMRTEISVTLKSRVTNDQAKVDKLVDFYSTMKPQQASKVIESLNEDLAVEVLDKMKKKNAAEIMNMMDSKKARRLSELLAGYERTTSSNENANNAQTSEAQAAPDRAPAAAAPAAPSKQTK